VKPLILCDADNTLWDTDAVYASAQLRLLAQVEGAAGGRAEGNATSRLAFVRGVDQALAARHPDHLAYPPRLLAIALRLRVLGVSAPIAAESAIDGALAMPRELDGPVSEFVVALRAQPVLREGVAEGLPMLSSARWPPVVVTESREGRCRELLRGFSLEAHVADVVELVKNTESYRGLSREFGSLPGERIMVGDQLDRDIRFAKQAGFTTVYFRGNFSPEWSRTADLANVDFEISSFVEVARIVGGFVPHALDHRR
jgi:putative hydrolase of the HAD superfamily